MNFSDIEGKRHWMVYQKHDYHTALRDIDTLRAVTTKKGRLRPRKGDVVWLWGKVSDAPGKDFHLRSCFIAGNNSGDTITAQDDIGLLFDDMPLLDKLDWFVHLKAMQPWARGPILLDLRHEKPDKAANYAAIQEGLIALLENDPDFGISGSSEVEVLEDQQVIRNDPDLSQTEKDRLICARVGQGAFRKDVLSLWGGQCAATLSSEQVMIIASHIVPWRRCESNEQRLDPANGIPLCASLDRLFDRGLITFKRSGEGREFYLRASSRLTNVMTVLANAGLTNGNTPQDHVIMFPRRGEDLERFAAYMERHAAEVFKP
ncbi:HNH endonuclease signature motif containing protein [Granulosicoccaceae sp. 1_MG-2023]|nr:HNH endonuclease signature motif containing protein [Granulosicoccaceae sp. 1_MG-2023]